LVDVPYEQVAAYDQQVFGIDREPFIRTWISQPGSAGFATLDAGEVTGYGLLRPCRDGYKVGPLFANGSERAEVLLDDLLGCARGAPVYIDVPTTNRGAVGIAEKRRLVPVFQTARMYRGPSPPLDAKRVFGVTSLELG